MFLGEKRVCRTCNAVFGTNTSTTVLRNHLEKHKGAGGGAPLPSTKGISEFLRKTKEAGISAAKEAADLACAAWIAKNMRYCARYGC